MKKFLLIFIVALVVGVGAGYFMSGGAHSHGDSADAEFRAGEHYLVLDKALSVPSDSFIAISNYACPFCYKYYKSVFPELLGKISATYLPFHLHSMGDYGVSASKVLAVAYAMNKRDYVAPTSDNSKFKKALMAYFDAFHEKKERWSNGADEESFVKTGLEASGISLDEYERALMGENVKSILSQWDEGYNIALKSGVPAFVVGGKYLIKTDKLKSTDELADLINFLSKSEQK